MVVCYGPCALSSWRLTKTWKILQEESMEEFFEKSEPIVKVKQLKKEKLLIFLNTF